MPDYSNESIQYCMFTLEVPNDNIYFVDCLYYDVDNSSTDYVTTENDHLVIRTNAEKVTWMEWDSTSWEPTKKSRNYTSGMVQSWNKFCFTGGVLEISVQLPGHPGSGGAVGNYLLEVFPGF